MTDPDEPPFPKPLHPGRPVTSARLRRRKEVLRGAKLGLWIRLFVVTMELIGFWVWRSSSLLLDALACGIDIFASLALIFCIYKADQPPDEEHPLGHGRFEPIAGLLVGFTLVILGCVAFIDQVKALTVNTIETELEPIIWVIPLIALLLLEWGYQRLKKTARRERSPALLADAVHYRIDALTSLLALVALGFAALFPSKGHVIDHLGATAISIFMVVAGLSSTRKNIHQLVDASPPDDEYRKVRKAAQSVPGVKATEKCHIQQYGPDTHVAIDIEVDPTMSVVESHKITQYVRRAIQRAVPSVRDVIVHVEPYYPGDHENRR